MCLCVAILGPGCQGRIVFESNPGLYPGCCIEQRGSVILLRRARLGLACVPQLWVVAGAGLGSYTFEGGELGEVDCAAVTVFVSRDDRGPVWGIQINLMSDMQPPECVQCPVGMGKRCLNSICKVNSTASALSLGFLGIDRTALLQHKCCTPATATPKTAAGQLMSQPGCAMLQSEAKNCCCLVPRSRTFLPSLLFYTRIKTQPATTKPKNKTRRPQHHHPCAQLPLCCEGS